MTELRMIAGRKPGEAWRHVGTVDVEPGWLVFVRDNPGTEWKSVKVVAAKPAARKANYWMGWNGSRFNNSRDAHIFSEHVQLLPQLRLLLEGDGLL